jgi:prepilin-type processing-associated H-X9-DG protein
MQNPGPPYPPPVPPPLAPPAKSGVPVGVWIAVGILGCFVLLIPILAAILFPVFAQAREQARRTHCLSNLKQAGLGVLMYAQDYDERFPIAERWATDISPYIKNESVFNCPKVNPTGEFAKESSGNVVYSYAFNSELSKLGSYKILEPFCTVTIFESDKKTKDASDPLTSIANPPRHNQGNNFGYADGHAKWMRADTDPKGGHSLTIDKTVTD